MSNIVLGRNVRITLDYLSCDMTMEQTARKHGVSHGRIGQIITQVLQHYRVSAYQDKPLTLAMLCRAITESTIYRRCDTPEYMYYYELVPNVSLERE